MKKPSKRNFWLRLVGYVLLVALLVGFEYHALTRPLPSLKPSLTATQLSVQAVPSSLTWPSVGQAAVGIVGTNVMHTNGTQKAVPIASTAKIITALVVLHTKPLAVGQQGPTLTFTDRDVALYNSYVAQGGSVVTAQAGEQISEYQVLEAMLLPSANNMADSLASWAFGSLPAYATAANAYLASLGLSSTHVGSDASGFSPTTTSNAADLVKIGELAMQNPVLAQIVAQPTVSGIPNAGSIKNINFLLGSDNIVGIKTGNTDQAGGVFLSASQVTINGKPVTIVTALLQAPTLFQALSSSLPMIRTAQADFGPAPVVAAGAVVGSYHQPWGGTLPAVASRDLKVTTAKGSTVPATIKLQTISANSAAGQVVGSVTVQPTTLTSEQTSPVILQKAPTKPTTWWRLLHPF